MDFVWFSLVTHAPNALTGEFPTVKQKLENVILQAELAERLGFEAYGVGERHGEPFLSSSPAVLLAAIAVRTRRIRLWTTVSVLSVLDPVRVAEDYATVDQLSGGRVVLAIGKGNDPRHYPLFGVPSEEQWDSLAERYELLKRLWTEERVTWQGRYRPPLYDVGVSPRPLQPAIPIWHGSASSTLSTELAARHGEPVFSSNAFHPRSKYKALIDHYRERLAFYGHDPARARVGAGSGGLYLAGTKEEAIRRFRPYYDAFSSTEASKVNQSPFRNLEDHIENGPLLVGSPESVVEKVLEDHRAFGHTTLGLSVDGLSEGEQREQMQRFAEEVAPILRREIPG